VTQQNRFTKTIRMRPEHTPVGDPCAKCGLLAHVHRHRQREARKGYFQDYNRERPKRERIRSSGGTKGYRKPECLGIDGEGFGHGSTYAYMACAGTTHTVSSLENLRGIATYQALDFLLELPRGPLKFGFSLGYDHTKILQDLPDNDLWLLARPEERMPESGPPDPVYYVGGGNRYALNMLGGRLSIARMGGHTRACENLECEGCKPGPKTILWDVFKFFQSSFVKACLDWNVISKEEFELLAEMKKKRPDFARPTPKVLQDGRILPAEEHPEWLEIKQYCQLECMKMAELATRLLQAHEDAGLKLKQYFGAGSTGAAMLDKMQARKFIRKKIVPKGTTKVLWHRIEYEQSLQYAIACAFFGGRFEIRQRGPIAKQCWSYDISSAYPYAFTFLPCVVHGKWRHVVAPQGTTSAVGDSLENEIEKAQTAIVRYALPYSRAIGKVKDETSERAWGPFPFRMGRGLEPSCNPGDIIFPVTSGGGWICREEYLAGRLFAPNVTAIEAWIFETDCDCKVLRHLMPENYKLRCSWGKEGKGQVAKLGQNSCYGKCAQTKGKLPPYQEFVWAALTTASCRAQLLRAMTTDIDSIVLLATDGIISTRKLNLETPKDTGTFETVDIKSGKKKPLGGWEEKKLPNGVFLIRPGIAFPLGDDPAAVKEAEFKARGIGKHVLKSMREEVLESWKKNGALDLMTQKQMFFGMKSQVYKTPAGVVKRTPRYGKFGMQDQAISYKPTPKRPAVSGNRFLTWALADHRTSIPYGPILGKPKTVSPLHKALAEEKMLNEDQDDSPEDDIREF
jgi:hypothetical protein